MKKLTLSLLCLMTIFIGTGFASDYHLFQGNFQVQFEDNTRIREGSAVENKSTNQWKNGGKVDNKEIDPAIFEQLKTSAPEYFKIGIEKKGVGDIRNIWFTDLSTNKKVKGFYDVKTRGFTIGQMQQAGTNKVETGVIKGYFNDDFSKITKGEYIVGFLAGKAPLVVSADATFFFDANVVDDKNVQVDVKEIESTNKGTAVVEKETKEETGTKNIKKPSNINTTKGATSKGELSKASSSGIVNKWKVGLHKKGWININYSKSDFVEFNSNGTYTHSLKGNNQKGEWTISDDGKQIIINADQKSTWNFKENKDGNFIFTRGNETMILKPFQ